MPSLEQIVAAFGDPNALPPFAAGRRHSLSLIGRRLFIARGPAGEFELFLAGPLASFAGIAPGRGIEWNTYHEPGGAEIEALCFRLPDDMGNARLVAHLAYEAYQRLTATPTLSNAALLSELQPYIGLIQERGLLSVNEQQGLLGELLLLERLLGLCAQQTLPLTNALSAWTGWSYGAARDFSRNGVVVEVKSTTSDVREHAVSSLEQLELSAGEHALYLYSVSLKPDQSGTLQLWSKVQSLLAGLPNNERGLLAGYLRSAGYDASLTSQYRLGPKFITTRFVAALYRVDDSLSRLRLSSFVGASLPANVSRVSYRLNLQAVAGPSNPLSLAAADAALLTLLI